MAPDSTGVCGKGLPEDERCPGAVRLTGVRGGGSGAIQRGLSGGRSGMAVRAGAGMRAWLRVLGSLLRGDRRRMNC